MSLAKKPPRKKKRQAKEPVKPLTAEAEKEMPLSRQEHFCRLVAIEYKTPFEAYCEAFGWDGIPKLAMNAAESMMNIEEIQKRIEELQPFQIEPPLGEDMLTLGEHLRELAQLEKIAVRMGQIGAAVNAAIHRGRASGLYVERSISATVTLEQLLVASRKDGQVAIQVGDKLQRIDDGRGEESRRRAEVAKTRAAARKAREENGSGHPLRSGPNGEDEDLR